MEVSAVTSIISIPFMIFTLATVVLYYLLPKKFRWCSLIVANTAFYIFGGASLILYLLAACFIAYIAGIWMDATFVKQKEECEGLDRKAKKPIKAKYTKIRKKYLVVSTIPKTKYIIACIVTLYL